jgi:hypothetical protein
VREILGSFSCLLHVLSCLCFHFRRHLIHERGVGGHMGGETHNLDLHLSDGRRSTELASHLLAVSFLEYGKEPD